MLLLESQQCQINVAIWLFHYKIQLINIEIALHKNELKTKKSSVQTVCMSIPTKNKTKKMIQLKKQNKKQIKKI